MPLPFKLKAFRRIFKKEEFKLLDVGAGNHSASNIKKHFPNCKYYGIDISKDYNNDQSDFDLMEEFWERDLTKLQFGTIPDNSFDAILMSHIIEHLENGDEVIKTLSPKLKPGGYIYIEYPSARSVNFPSKIGTLNFYDDPTHVRIYTLEELNSLFSELDGFSIVKAETRRDLLNILLMPAKGIYNKIKRGYIPGYVYWDLYGFAEFVLARKKE